MKKVGLYVLAFLIWVPAFAQKTEDLFEQLTNKYSDKDGFSASMISKDMFDLYLKKKNVDSESSVYESIKTLDRILVISQGNFNAGFITGVSISSQKPDNEKEEQKNELVEEFLDHYKTGGYTLLKTEKRMGEEVRVYLKKYQDKIESLAVLSNSNANTSLVELQGDINLTAVADLSKAFNLRGLENLNKINNSGSSYYLGTTITGSALSQERLQEIFDRQRELAADKQQILTDEQRAKFEEQMSIASNKQSELAEKARELSEKYRREPIFLNYPGDSTTYYVDGEKVEPGEIRELLEKGVKSIDFDKPDKENGKTVIRIKTK